MLEPIEVGAVNPNALAVAPDVESSLIFADGFESGNTAAWSATVPPMPGASLMEMAITVVELSVGAASPSSTSMVKVVVTVLPGAI